MKADFGPTADDYARHRAVFPDSLFERLIAFRVGLRGQTVVDLGTGTGALARGFARNGCRVIGVDPSAEMLERARWLDEQAGVAIEYQTGRAEETGLEGDSADVVSAGQCWHWFDGAHALRESERLLKPEGHLLIAHFDWLPLAGNLVEATERLIATHNPAWSFAGGTGIYPRWFRDLAEGGFRDLKSFTYDVDVPYMPEDWRGRIRASAGVGGTLPPDAVSRFDRDLRDLLEQQFPGRPLSVPHRVFGLVAKPPRPVG